MSVFVAWMPDDEARAALADLQRSVRDCLGVHVARLRWRPRDRLHMTVRYLGDGPTLAAEVLRALPALLAPVCRDAAPCSVPLERIEVWPQALVARACAEPTLLALFAAVEAAVRASGGLPETRDPSPHVTLAYAGRSRPLPVPAMPRAGFPTLRVDALHLVESGRFGYRTIACWPLQGTATP
jgi:2'-5' RNA ligase